MRTVQLGHFARADVRRIASYLDRKGFDISVSRRFLAAFETTCIRLAKHPDIGQTAKREHDSEPSRRRVVMDEFPKYLIFYRISASAIMVERVLHGAQNLPSLLKSKEQQ